MANLSSLWDGLNPHLLAHFYEVEPIDSEEKRHWSRTLESPVVTCAVSESSLQADLQWQSPFENTGAEAKIPTLSSMLQNGAIQQFSDSLIPSRWANEKVTSALDEYVGRTGITRLNSTQVFSGMPPVKINVTVHFRAWRSARQEVERPFSQLMKWALPRKLSEDGSIIARLADKAQGSGESAAETLMPSLTPSIIGMTYKGRTFSPLVIESIDFPMSSPINEEGDFVHLAIQMTLCTLTAIDGDDWDDFNSKSIVL